MTSRLASSLPLYKGKKTPTPTPRQIKWRLPLNLKLFGREPIGDIALCIPNPSRVPDSLFSYSAYKYKNMEWVSECVSVCSISTIWIKDCGSKPHPLRRPHLKSTSLSIKYIFFPQKLTTTGANREVTGQTPQERSPELFSHTCR